MNRRRNLLLTLLLAVSFTAYLKYRAENRLGMNPIRRPASTGMYEPDVFDTPYNSDPPLVAEFAHRPVEFPFRSGDRVAWIGSSSTYIGVWPKTLEFLLRSRHPELELTFSRHSSGGGTYSSAAARLPDWLERSNPTVVFFNFGANDAYCGKQWLNEFHDAMRACALFTLKSGARVFHITPQSGDVRKSGTEAYFRKKHYADDMLEFCKTNGWEIVDVHHPLENLQLQTQALDAQYSINTDVIHLTDAAYVDWGYFLYDRLNPPVAVSSLELDAKEKRVVAATRCKARVVETESDLVFTREDEVLPILPPHPLPSSESNRLLLAANAQFDPPADPSQLTPEQNACALPQRRFAPIKKQSQYLLKISGLSAGDYLLECDGKPAGRGSGSDFAEGVNLNLLVLDAGVPAPWEALAIKLWNGSRLSDLEGRRMVFKLKRNNPEAR